MFISGASTMGPSTRFSVNGHVGCDDLSPLPRTAEYRPPQAGREHGALPASAFLHAQRRSPLLQGFQQLHRLLRGRVDAPGVTAAPTALIVGAHLPPPLQMFDAKNMMAACDPRKGRY